MESTGGFQTQFQWFGNISVTTPYNFFYRLKMITHTIRMCLKHSTTLRPWLLRSLKSFCCCEASSEHQWTSDIWMYRIHQKIFWNNQSNYFKFVIDKKIQWLTHVQWNYKGIQNTIVTTIACTSCLWICKAKNNQSHHKCNL